MRSASGRSRPAACTVSASAWPFVAGALSVSMPQRYGARADRANCAVRPRLPGEAASLVARRPARAA